MADENAGRQVGPAGVITITVRP
eukprot:COSAG03_NODE_19233_length_340_cov_1.290456_1_plen_22_part_01